MSANLLRYLDALRVMCKLQKRVRIAMIASSPPLLVSALCELLANLLDGVIPDVDVSRLQRYKKELRALARRGQHPEYKKRLFIQGGGKFMPELVPFIDRVKQLLQ